MESSQVKWLLIGLGGAVLSVSLLVGGVFFIASNAIELGDSDEGSRRYSSDGGVDAPAEWHRWAQNERAAAARNKAEYDRLAALYEFVSPYREIRRRLFHEGDYEYAEEELKKQFAALADPLAALSYSESIDRLSEFTYDTNPEELRTIVRTWTEALPDSHFAWLVRGRQAISYAWYWRGSGWASSVSDQGWENFGKAIDEAAECFETAYRLQPKDAEIAAGMITVCMAQERPRKEMEVYFERAIEVVPAHLGAYAGKFQFLRPAWSGSWPEYQEFLDGIDAKVAEQGHPILRIAERRARDDMEKEQADDGTRSDEQRKKSKDEWLEIRRDMLDRWPNDVLTRGLYAKELMNNNKATAALSHFQVIGNRYPMEVGWNLSTFHQQRFQAYMLTSTTLRGEARIELCNEALELDPEYYGNYQSLAFAHDANGDYDLAEAAILRAMELKPEFGGTHLQMANVYKKTNRIEEALAEVKRAQELQMEDAMRSAAVKLEKELKGILNRAESAPANP